MAATMQPISEDAFTADRQHFLHGFVTFVASAASIAALLLILMAIFLV
ncbi:MAG: hypothetical protein KGK10_11250 [Rhodospirillales bacterium]|nr:hypothetical protein [Rhodospirillales bacterium]